MMQIKVVQKNGEILFVETKANFVNLLIKIQHLPIGALARIATTTTGDHHQKNKKKNAFVTLQNSCWNLSDHLFIMSRKNKVLFSDNDIDLTELINNNTKKKPTLKTHNMTYTGNGNGPYTCTSSNTKNCYNKAVAFRNFGTSFEITLRLNGKELMLGVLPDNCDLLSRISIKDLYNRYGCFVNMNSNAMIHPQGDGLYDLFNGYTPRNGNELKMRFQHELQKLEYSYNGNEWHGVTIRNGQYGNNQGTTYCPVVLGYDNNPITVTEVKSLNNKEDEEDFFKTEGTFLVTNELMVSDCSSFSSQLQILQKYQVSDVLSLKTTTVSFGIVELQKLIHAIFNGEEKILQVALDGNKALLDVDTSQETTIEVDTVTSNDNVRPKRRRK